MTSILTITTLPSPTVGTWLSLVAVALMIVLLIAKETASGVSTTWANRLSRVLNVALLPLLLAFAVISLVRIIEVVR